MSPPVIAGVEVRGRGTGSGEAGAIQGDQSGASALWSGASGREGAWAWRWGSEGQSGAPGRRPAAAAAAAAAERMA